MLATAKNRQKARDFGITQMPGRQQLRRSQHATRNKIKRNRNQKNERKTQLQKTV